MQVTEVSLYNCGRGDGGERVVATPGFGTSVVNLPAFSHPHLFIVLEREGGDGNQLINPDTLPEFSSSK